MKDKTPDKPSPKLDVDADDIEHKKEDALKNMSNIMRKIKDAKKQLNINEEPSPSNEHWIKQSQEENVKQALPIDDIEIQPNPIQAFINHAKVVEEERKKANM